MDFLGLFITIKNSNNYPNSNYIYYKTNFVEIIYIIIKSTIFSFNIIYKRKLLTNNF